MGNIFNTFGNIFKMKNKAMETNKETMEQQDMNQEETVENTTNTSDHNSDETTEQVDELAQLKAEKEGLKDKYIRLVAEFDNYKRRTSKQIMEIRETATEGLMISLLEIMDDYDRAKDSLDKADDVKALKEGVHLIFNKLINTFKAKGLVEMEAKEKDFDADQHEAIAEIPSPTPELEGKVIDVVQKGYILNDKIIRHAKVVVGKKVD